MTSIKLQEKGSSVNAKRLANKVAIVTGGSRGIGASIALRLAEEGASVAISYANNKDLAEKVVEEIKAIGSKAIAVKADVTSKAASQKLVEEAIKNFGKIDILVNNAGVFEGASIEDMDIEHYERIFDINVKGLVASTIAAVKHIADGGRIINVSSIAAIATVPAMSVYAATKSAINTLTRIWAQDLGHRGITVNGVAPGATETDMLNSGMDSKTQEKLIAQTSLARLGQPDDIANVVVFLASDEGGWVSGQTIGVDGGLKF